jgi:Na+-driven multidrug efflux pump
LFNASDEMMTIGVLALRRISLCFMFAGFCIILGSTFQAFGEGLFSMLVSIGRQLVVLIPAAYLLARTGSVGNVWWSFPIAEIASVILSIIFFRHTYKKCIKTL